MSYGCPECGRLHEACEVSDHDIQALLAAKASLVKLEGAIVLGLLDPVADNTWANGDEYIADEKMRPITVWRDELVKPLQDLLRTLKTTPLPEPEEEEEAAQPVTR